MTAGPLSTELTTRVLITSIVSTDSKFRSARSMGSLGSRARTQRKREAITVLLPFSVRSPSVEALTNTSKFCYCSGD